MDILQLCTKTGQNEWYIQNLVKDGLIVPDGAGQFPADQAERAEQIVWLRKLLLRDEDIRRILQNPQCLSSVLAVHMRALREDKNAPQAACMVMDIVWRKNYATLNEFIDDLRLYSRELSQVDLQYELAAPACGPSDTNQLDRVEKKGKWLTLGIVIFQIFDLASALFQALFLELRNLPALIGSLVAVALLGAAIYFFWKGVVWIRYLYIIVHGCNAVFTLFSLLSPIDNIIVTLVYLISALLSAVVFSLLLFNSSVKEFLYRQRYH